ncbi:MAG: chemotaxis protein CheW [Acetanaerobacterium sp.]
MEGFLETQGNYVEGKYLTFLLDDQSFAVPISDVVQIIGIQPITPIPELPDYAKGIINLRGSILPVIDLNLRFGREETQYSERTCIIVINIFSVYMGFIVDAVDEVTDIPAQDIKPPPKVSREESSNYISGIGKRDIRVTLVLNTARILSDTAFARINNGV